MTFGTNSDFGFGGSNSGGGGGTVTGANDGLTLSGANVQLGQTVGAGGDPAVLLEAREIPFGGFSLALLDRATLKSVTFNPTSALGSVQVLNNQVNHLITGANADGWFAFWTPSNYLTTYAGGNPNPQTANRFYTGYGLFTGVNPDGRPNVVGIPWAYNATVAGGRAVTTDGGFQFRTETHFIINGNASTPAHFEFHLPEITTYGGSAYRIWSMYADKASGDTFIQSCNSSVVFFDATTNDPGLGWATFTKSNGGGSISLNSYNAGDIDTITLSNTTHGSATFAWNTGLLQLKSPLTKDWDLEGRDVVTSFRRWDWTTSQLGGNGWSMVFNQSPVFAGTESIIQIYGNGNTSSTQSFQIRRPGIVNRSFTIFDDGTVMACGSNNTGIGDGQFSIGIQGSIANIDAGAKLQVESTTQAFYPPSVTTTQKNAMTVLPRAVVFDKTLDKLCVFTASTGWQTITSV